jgi:deoxyribonuclease-4
MSIAGGVHRAIERGHSIGCNTIQIFLKNNMQWGSAPISNDDARRFREARGAMPVFAHSSYLINLAATNAGTRQHSITSIADEIRRADALGISFIVMHPGAHMGAGENAGMKTVARSLDAVFGATKTSKVRIALETTAGQGTCLGHRFEHLAEIIQLAKHPKRLAVCVDTCHLFAAGYDIRTPQGYETTMRKLTRTVGRKQIVAFHLNDSKKLLGSHVDRHEHIGKGYIGLDAFRCVLRDARWQKVPMVLETPKGEEMREDVENLQMLRSLL